MTSTATPDEPWALLARVHGFTIRVYPGAPASQVATHEGAGQVHAEHAPSSTEARVVWHEAGRWSVGPLAGVAFHNATEWRRVGPDTIALSHLRRGTTQPTMLVDLRPDPRTAGWRSVAPHECGADRYRAHLLWDSRSVVLTWEVESPTDPYRLRWEGHLG